MGEALRRLPCDTLEREALRIANEIRDQVEHKKDGCPLRIRPRIADHLTPNARLNSEFLFEFTSQCVGRRLAAFDFASRKLPLQAVRIRLLALTNEDATVTDDECGSHFNHWPARSPRTLVWQTHTLYDALRCTLVL